jgi:hypothetical protein
MEYAVIGSFKFWLLAIFALQLLMLKRMCMMYINFIGKYPSPITENVPNYATPEGEKEVY